MSDFGLKPATLCWQGRVEVEVWAPLALALMHEEGPRLSPSCLARVKVIV